jgi:transposase
VKKLIRLRKQAQRDKEPRVALRIQGIILSLEGYTTGDIGTVLKVNRTTVSPWINNWNSFREEGLLEGYRSGRKRKLDLKDQEKLGDILESGPLAYGLDTGVWTSVLIADVIEEEFNVHYHPGHVRKLLKKLGFSVQRPTTTLIDAEPKEINRWIRYTEPNLKKKRPAKKRQLSTKTKRRSARRQRSTRPGRA